MNLLRRVTALLAGMLLMTITACQQQAQPPKAEPLKRPGEAFLTYGETNETIVELSRINSSVWVHTSYYEENGSLTSSNGLVVVTETGLVLIDTPCTEKQMESLDKLIREYFNGSFKEAIITHADTYSMGGAAYLRSNNIPIVSLEIVAKTAEKNGFIVPDQVIEGDLAELEIDQTEFQICFPGEGYSSDNTVVWLEKHNVLFAGYLIEESGANSLGETSKANVNDWPISIQAIQEKYPDIEIVVPGHGQWGDASLIDLTLDLFEE